MKKSILLLSVLLPLAIGCHPKEQGFDGTWVKGSLQSTSITWAAGDSIGVSGTTNGNYRFVLDAKSAGLAEGKFLGNMTVEETPVAAYYPYDPKAGSTAIESVNLTLPSVQASKDNGPDMSYDARVAGTPTGSVSEGFTFNFVRKFATVRVDVTVDADMAGKNLLGLFFEAKNKALSGKFLMNLKDPYAALNFTTPVYSVSVNYASPKALSEGQTISAYFLVNPSIVKNDSLFVTLPLNTESVIIKITSDQAIEAGNSYTYSLNVAQLRGAGKVFVDKGEGTIFTNIEKYGVFDLSKGVISSFITYSEGEEQYSTYANASYHFFSIVNMEKGKATKVRMPKSATTLNQTYSIQSSSAGISLPNSTYSSTLVKISGNMYWYEDKTDKIGFILYRK